MDRPGPRAKLIIRLIRKGIKTVHVPRFFATFTLTGKNLCMGQKAHEEQRYAFQALPTWIKLCRWPINGLRLLEKLGSVIRERYRIRGAIKALTAEGRLRAGNRTARYPQHTVALSAPLGKVLSYSVLLHVIERPGVALALHLSANREHAVQRALHDESTLVLVLYHDAEALASEIIGNLIEFGNAAGAQRLTG